MSEVTQPIILDTTGQAIAAAIAGIYDAVHYTQDSGKTSEQKQTARNNIGLGNVPNTDFTSRVEALEKGGVPVATSIPEAGMLPRVHYAIDYSSITAESPAIVPLLQAGASGYENNYIWVFKTGSVAPTITWDSSWSWVSSAPTISANKIYEIRICDNGSEKLALAVEYTPASNE